MELTELYNVDGVKFDIISKGESLGIFKEFEMSVETITFLKHVYEDLSVLNLLTNHKSNISVVEGSNYPMFFSIDSKSKSNFEEIFNKVSEMDSTKTKQELNNLLIKVLPKVLGGHYGKSEDDMKKEIISHLFRGSILIYIYQVMNDVKKEELQKLMGLFISEVAGDIIPTALAYLNTSKGSFVNFGIDNRKNIIDASNIDEENYEAIVKRLETYYNVIYPFVSLYWCERTHDSISFYTIGSSINGKCPNCDSDLLKCTFYYIRPDLIKLLRADEGFIKSLTMFLINESGLCWLPDVYLEGLSDSEKDIVIETGDMKYTIVEVKNYAKDVPIRTKKMNIDKAMNQALKQLRKYKEYKIYVEKIYIVFNYCYEEELHTYVNHRLSDPKFSDFREIEFSVIGIDTLDQLKQELTSKLPS